MTTPFSKTLIAGAVTLLSGGAFAGDGTGGPVTGNLPAGAPLAAFDATYNVCRGPYPQCYNNWINRDAQPNTVLIYSRTAGPRHGNLGPALAAGVNRASNPTAGAHADREQRRAAGAADLAGRRRHRRRHHRRRQPDPGLGNSYKAVIFMSPTRDTLWLHGKQARSRSTPGQRLDRRAQDQPAPVHARRAAASSASTTRSARNTTGRTTKACSATPTTTITAPTRTAR